MIGVFDSGFGGLTVLDALTRRLPTYDYVYLGDSARAPYGGRSFDTILEFTREAVEHLFAAGCPLVILACNTASARALRTLQQDYLPRYRPDRRLLGVVRPSAEALAGLPPTATAGDTSVGRPTGTVAVLGTLGTVASNSYVLELAHLAPGLRVVQRACPLWVPLVEAGALDGPGVDHFIRQGTDPLFLGPGAPRPDRILLACTHYPLLLPAIRAAGPPSTDILVQGDLVADRLADWLHRHPDEEARLGRGGTRQHLTTDDPAWFATQGSRLVGHEIRAEKIRLLPVNP